MGRIVHIDRFGNCITNITQEHLHEHALGPKLIIEIIDQQLTGLFRTYVDGPVGIPMCLIGSSGHLELAVRNGNAAQYLGVDIGDKLRVSNAERNGQQHE
jgi:S-adenosylmethionine hydrolase